MANDYITDPELLAELRGNVTDPELLKQLRGEPQQEQSEFDKLSAFDQFATGAGKPGWELYYGAKDLVTDLSPENEQHLRNLEQAKGGWAMGGEMLTDAAAMWMPGKAIARVGQGLRALPRALASIGAESAAVGTYEGTKAPEKGETRLGNATTAAAVTGGLGAVAPIAKGIVGHMTPTARRLLNADVDLTPGMAYPRLAGVERQMSSVPVVGRSVQNMQDRAIEQWNRNLLQEVAPPGRRAAITTHGREGFRQLRTQFDEAYADIWNGIRVDDLNLHDLSRGWDNAVEDLRGLSDEALGPVENAMRRSGRLLSDFANTGDTGYISQADDLLREMAGQVDPVTAPHIQRLRRVMLDALPPNVGGTLRDTDAAWAKYKTAERAQGYVRSMETDRINPRQLQTSIDARTEPGQLARGEGLLQNPMDNANETFNNVLSQRSATSSQGDLYNVATGAALATNPQLAIPTLAAGRGLATEPVRRIMTGGLRTREQELARMLRIQAGLYTSD